LLVWAQGVRETVFTGVLRARLSKIVPGKASNLFLLLMVYEAPLVCFLRAGAIPVALSHHALTGNLPGLTYNMACESLRLRFP
jgi:hypothetical protein